MSEFIPVIIFCIISALAGFQIGQTYSPKKNMGVPIEYQSSDINIPCLEKLKALKEFIENIDIPENSKKPISKAVLTEYDYIERKSMLDLGRETYKKSQEKNEE